MFNCTSACVLTTFGECSYQLLQLDKIPAGLPQSLIFGKCQSTGGKKRDLTQCSVNIPTYNLDLIRTAQVDILHFSLLTLRKEGVEA